MFALLCALCIAFFVRSTDVPVEQTEVPEIEKEEQETNDTKTEERIDDEKHYF